MLGYVKIDRGELKVREYEIYCGYYCGVCKSIGRRYGQLPRMALSYDAAFLAVMLAALDDKPDAPNQEHCIGHQIKKKTIIRNEAIDYAADVMLILAWYKLLDDAHDEGKISAKITANLLKGIYKKLRAKHPALCSGIEEHLHNLTALEKEKCAQLDMAAEAFSKIMEIIFAEGTYTILGKPNSENDAANSNQNAPVDNALNNSGSADNALNSGSSAENTPTSSTSCDNMLNDSSLGDNVLNSNSSGDNAFNRNSSDNNANAQGEPQGAFLAINEIPPSISPQTALAKIGYHMGKWIYLMDAIDDIEENLQSGAYNPLLYRFDYDARNETPAEFRKRIRDDLKFNLYHYLAMVGNYVNLLDIKKNQGIIENIIYFGLNRKTEEILSDTEPQEQI